jgi:N6-L-threonylcarbamoyladenine synthase
VVSGGHTQLVLMKKHLYYKIIGETQDDAAGEAFDKVARILGLGYPGGPIISQLAACNSQPKIKKSFKFPALPAGRQVSSFKINLPRPMIDSPNFNFSFSGLKTAVLYETKKHPELMKKPDYIAALCQEFQNAATEVLIAKTIRAAQKYHPRSILLAGGVSANLELRKKLGAAIRKELKKTAYYIPEIKYALDNSAMIAAASFFRWKLSKKKTYPWQTVEANANLKLSSL